MIFVILEQFAQKNIHEDLILLKKPCMYSVNFSGLIFRTKCPNTPKPKCVNYFSKY